MSLDPEDLVFVVGATLQGAVTELWLLEKKGVMARDPAALEGVDTSRILGLPYQYNRTLEGFPGLSTFMGTAEEARKAMEACGVTEAPISIDVENDQLVYVTKDDEAGGLYGPVARALHKMEVVTSGTIQAVKVTIYHRFPGETDWPATLESLPPVVAQSIPYIDETGSFVTIHDADLLRGWLEQGKVAQDIA